MAVAFKASVSQSVPVAGIVTLTFTDASTGVSGLVSRVLNIYDYNDVLLITINMGATLTATYNVAADGYFRFQEIITDGSGVTTGVVNFLSTSFYMYAYAPAVSGINNFCGDLTGQIYNLSNAQNNRYAAMDMTSFGQGVIAQQLITYANFLVVTPYYA